MHKPLKPDNTRAGLQPPQQAANTWAPEDSGEVAPTCSEKVSNVIELFPPSRRDSTRWKAAVGLKKTTFDEFNQKTVCRAAEELDVTPDDLRAAVNAYGSQPEGSTDENASSFSATVRALDVPDSEGELFEGDVAEVMRAIVEADVGDMFQPIIRWSGIQACCALDLDCPEGGVPLTDDELSAERDALFPGTLPRPLAVWRTHGGGLRAIFVSQAEFDLPADACAGTWHLLANLGRLAGWSCEAKTDSRHPGGERDGSQCGPVHWFEPTETLVVPGHQASIASDQEIEAWLEGQGLKAGGRYKHERCPFDPSPSSGSPPVMVYNEGVKCFRCGGLGLRSVASWDVLCDSHASDGRPTLYEAAKRLVHIDHQLHVLRQLRPQTPESLLKPIWWAMLSTVHQVALAREKEERGKTETAEMEQTVETPATDGRQKALDRGFVPIVRSSGNLWLDATSLAVRNKIGMPTMGALAWCRSPADMERALDTVALEGFVGLHPVGTQRVLHPEYQPPPGSIVVRRSQGPTEPPPVKLEKPTNEEVAGARDEVERMLPGVQPGLLLTLIVVGLEAQLARSEPPIVVITGPTGSGKTTTVRLAGAALGARAAEVHIDTDARVTRREVGLAIEGGACLLSIDEVGRVRGAYYAIQALLALNGTLRFDAKYQNERTVRVEAAIALTGSTIPKAMFGPEMARRSVGFHLPSTLPGPWNTNGKDIARARDDEGLRTALDTLTRWVWWQISDAGPAFRWRDFCIEALGALRVDALDSGGPSIQARDEAIRRLYEAWRTASTSQLYEGKRWGPDWLKVSRGEANNLLGELIEIGGDKKQIHAETSELERLDLAPILGFREPSLQLKIRSHGSHWIVKFIETGVLRGREQARTSLPAAVES